MNEQMSEYLGVFLDEASEQIALLEEQILKLEHGRSDDLLNEIFRAAHTLKGSSRAMGFMAMGDLMHALEDVFQQLRVGALDIHEEMIDAVFAAIDTLGVMNDEIRTTGTSTLDPGKHTQRLRAVLGRSESPGHVEKTAPASGDAVFDTVLQDSHFAALEAGRSTGRAVRHLSVSIVPDCMMKSVRAMLVLRELEQLGSIVVTAPSIEALSDEEFDSRFDILFVTDADDVALKDAALSVTDVVGVECRPWSEHRSGGVVAAPVRDGSHQEADDKQTGTGVVDKTPDDMDRTRSKEDGNRSQTVRVDVNRLDNLLNLVGELIIDRTRISQLALMLDRQFARCELVEQLTETAAHVGRITDALQDEIMKARMLPVGTVFSRFTRMVRDLAVKLDKEVELIIEGGQTELDRSVMELIGDPLIHMLRNSVDHGIELPNRRIEAGKQRSGSIYLRARHQEDGIVIEVEDDGRGIDPATLRTKAVENGLLTPDAAQRLSDREALRLIFAAGFTTADAISDVSGRGVGMDIVRSNLERVGAVIDIDSVPGRGTRVTIKLPLTLAIIRALLVTAGNAVFAVPLSAVVETVRAPIARIRRVGQREVMLHRGSTMPLVRLDDVLPTHSVVARPTRMGDDDTQSARTSGRSTGFAEKQSDCTTALCAADETCYLVVVGQEPDRAGLVVDSLLGEQEVVIKSLGKFIGEIQGISGATILGDGRVALIVDVAGIINVSFIKKGMAHAA